LAKCAQLYEKLTQQPILNPIIRVRDPSPEDTSLNDEQVHTFAPNSQNVQKKIYLLLHDNNALWKKKQKNLLEKQIEKDIKMYTNSVIEYKALKKYKTHEVIEVKLSSFLRMNISYHSSNNYFYKFTGHAISRSFLLKYINNKNSKTYVEGKIECHFDDYGRINYSRSFDINYQ